MKGGVAMNRFVWLSRLVFEACLATLLVALAIANLSGISILHHLVELFSLQNELGPVDAQRREEKTVPVAAPVSVPPRLPLLSTLREEMKKAGIGTSCCFDERRSGSSEFYICLGRVPCHDLPQANIYLKAAPHVLKTSEGQRKEAEVIQNVAMHVQKQLGTSNLRAVFEHIRNSGLACDKFDASQYRS